MGKNPGKIVRKRLKKWDTFWDRMGQKTTFVLEFYKKSLTNLQKMAQWDRKSGLWTTF